ncbi:hypothetical protein NQ318_016393 [Aromia moschata]|uniref:Peroxisomal leader peptide-processing protease n=1 Tax=Aromia moschata TaxID=1265417 RepID=A0AAV8Z3R0_9CUCU|nr:hypothetical protein NQ318_016393 [Aromia moschata]
MKVRLVLIEKEDRQENRVLGCSGIMLDEKYVIATGNLFQDSTKYISEDLQPGKLHAELFINYDAIVNIVWRENELYNVKNARIFATFISGKMKNSSTHIFQNWAVDSIDNNRNLNDILSQVFILTFQEENLEDLKRVLTEWWASVASLEVTKGDTLFVRTVPFGNRDFIDSCTKGIVSNILGQDSCFILSDCPTTPGAEGSPVYLLNSNQASTELPVGIVLVSVSWWKGEWVGLTLIVDVKSILLELIDVPIRTLNVKNKNSKIIATTEFSLVQIYSGNNWGTAILLDAEKGIFITNSHVIESNQVRCFYKDKSWTATLIYKAQEPNALDIALIKSNTSLQDLPLRSITISRKIYKLGDIVYSAGFSLFSKECRPTPTLTKGCISQLSPSMVKTTCSIHPGASGGAILDDDGLLVGVIVCNIKFHESGTAVIYPRVNAAVPYSAVADTISKFMEIRDLSVGGRNFYATNRDIRDSAWIRLENKL